jgi:16S rRNA (uracil1498-N3)-methyltransferase
MQLFYAPALQGEFYTLSEEESKHIIRVLRMKAGDSIRLTDGLGNMFTAELVNEDHRRCEVKVMQVEKEYGKRDYRTHMAVAPTKNIKRYEWFLEKATEIGIDEISPLICQRSERKEVKTERLNKVITAALKQSLKAYHPQLHESASFKKFISAEYPGGKYIAYVEEGEHPLLSSLYKAGTDAMILIGPEGDFSPDEVAQAKEHGFVTVSLGNSRLRTETAGIVACHTIALMNNE